MSFSHGCLEHLDDEMAMKKSSKGFTLIELMIVVAIIGILAAIAYPSYEEQVRKSRRAEATEGLMDVAARMERYYADKGEYLGATIAGFWGDNETEEGWYQVGFTELTDDNYTIQAVPAGAQATDKCGNFTLTSLGIQGVNGGSLTDVNTCW
jgi:type IV pilus assembly protein PilE